MIHGVDVSNNNGTVDLSGFAFMFAKASEGVFFSDPLFAAYWGQAAAKGMLRGAYHFGHPGSSADRQAGQTT